MGGDGERDRERELEKSDPNRAVGGGTAAVGGLTQARLSPPRFPIIDVTNGIDTRVRTQSGGEFVGSVNGSSVGENMRGSRTLCCCDDKSIESFFDGEADAGDVAAEVAMV
jgi:hypothetical protein